MNTTAPFQIALRRTFAAFTGLLLATSFLTATASASPISDSIDAGVGGLNYQPSVASTSATSGSKPYFGQLFPTMALKAYYNFYEDFSVSPEFNFALLARKSAEGQEKLSASSFSLRFCEPVFFEGFDLHFGPGLLAYQIKGEGGTQEQSNGSGTSTFGIPSGTRTSVTLTADVGMGYQFNSYRAELSFLISQPASSTKRTINPLLTISTRVF
jgi:hypothetical protein